MTFVKLNEKFKCCATCTYWGGPRRVEQGCSVFDNNVSGICGGETFNGWKISAISTCVKWELWQGMHE
jgi:hypothetical protein